ncbi:hypothetical protein M409DRAFT_28673 [Zasmidium cellare ATCC 36951]|uniref:NAD(P)-binding protein n=1 Tax=Zasmidium cellare ATCC 36951 TaxID=1080233 RepID=A0A6A6C3N0_ZASCE|nr:uncharacterized protein M409DRAFT_28673 [Zasmidium cellare ATCC 36951]KAF2160790.1 hypothetical protein M409DRAFT_28673 [Zasmidium cellare ATCC 36951]
MSWTDFFQSCYFIPPPTLTEHNLPSQSGRVFIVTGGYSGVGKELAKLLYQAHGTIYIAGRDASKGQAAIEEIKSLFPTSDGRLEFLFLDLADLSTIKSSAETFIKKESRLDVLTNNAGVMTPPVGSRTAQGHELQMGTNALGHYLFTTLLLPILLKTAQISPAKTVRITWASSLATFMAPPGGILFDITTTTSSPRILNSPMRDYQQSKSGTIFLAHEFQSRYPSIVSVPFNPGNLHSELQRTQSWWLWIVTQLLAYPTKMGAYTELWAGWAEEVGEEGNRGRYVGPWGRFRSVRGDIENNRVGVERFVEWCEEETAGFL